MSRRTIKSIVWPASLSLLVALIAVVVCPTNANPLDTETDNSAPPSPNFNRWSRFTFKIPKMMEFQQFMMKFHKHYSSLSEKIVRRKLFIMRTLKAAASDMLYMCGFKNYRLGINELSDYTPEEVERMENHHLLDNMLRDDKKVNDGDRQGEREAQHRVRRDVVGVSRGQAEQKPPNYEKISSDRINEVKESRDLLENDTIDLLTETIDEETSELDLSISEDEIFIDHRDCMLPARNQGVCGSCYAHTAISLLEWRLCKDTGEKVALSEQYILDCGRVSGNLGCVGGNVETVSEFIHNYGAELRDEYPYYGLEGQCPYEHDLDVKKTGKYRTGIVKWLAIPLEHWEEYLRHGPIFVLMAASQEYLQYSSGVHDDLTCGDSLNHGMVLVGHGRESGEGYWLLRNSLGPTWGEGGYYKMSKKTKCLPYPEGFVFGTNNGRDYIYQAQLNRNHNSTLVIQNASGRPFAPELQP